MHGCKTPHHCNGLNINPGLYNLSCDDPNSFLSCDVWESLVGQRGKRDREKYL